MNTAEMIEFLESYQNARRFIRLYTEEINDIKTRAAQIMRVLTGKQRARVAGIFRDMIAGNMCQIAEEKKTMQAVADLIQTVPDAKYRELLTLRYIQGLKWEEIARRMYYADETTPQKRHKAAIAHLCAASGLQSGL
jgi:hypothetical protein